MCGEGGEEGRRGGEEEEGKKRDKAKERSSNQPYSTSLFSLENTYFLEIIKLHRQCNLPTDGENPH